MHITSKTSLMCNLFINIKQKAVRKKFSTGDYSITEPLKIIVDKEGYFEQYFFDQQPAYHGRSGLYFNFVDGTLLTVYRTVGFLHFDVHLYGAA